MHIFFARSISLWTGSLDKYEVAKRTAVIFFVFVGQQRQGHGKLFCTSSLANDLHSALTPIPLRATKKNYACFASLRMRKYESWEKKEEGTGMGRRTGKGEGEGRDNLPFLLLIPPSLPATSLEANSSWVLPTAVCLQAAALLLWLDNVHT